MVITFLSSTYGIRIVPLIGKYALYRSQTRRLSQFPTELLYPFDSKPAVFEPDGIHHTGMLDKVVVAVEDLAGLVHWKFLGVDITPWSMMSELLTIAKK